MKLQFTEAEQARIREAVAAAEGHTSGEIVPFLMPRSGHYEIAMWRGGVLLAAFSLLVSLLVIRFYEGWGLAWIYTGWGTALVTLAGGVLGGVLAAYLPPLKRLLAGGTRLSQNVHRRALQAFVEEEVFDTRERTGILLFVSLFERRIDVLGDTGINQHVEADDWADVVLRIRDGIKKGDVVSGLVEAIGLCGKLLERKGVEIRADDTNELTDNLRIRDDDAS